MTGPRCHYRVSHGVSATMSHVCPPVEDHMETENDWVQMRIVLQGCMFTVCASLRGGVKSGCLF